MRKCIDDFEHNAYNLEGHDYVVYDGKVFYPAMDVNSDVPITGLNIAISDWQLAAFKTNYDPYQNPWMI